MDLKFKQSPKPPVPSAIAWVCSFCYFCVFGVLLGFIITSGVSRLVSFIVKPMYLVFKPIDLIVLLCFVAIWCIKAWWGKDTNVSKSCLVISILLCLVLIFSQGFYRIGKYFYSLDFSILDKSDIILMMILLFIGIFLVFCLNTFEWFLNPRLRKSKDGLIFETDDVIAALGKPTTTTTIKTVKSFHIKKNSIVVEGDITIKEPIGKSRSRTGCEIVGLYDAEDKTLVIGILEEMLKCQND